MRVIFLLLVFISGCSVTPDVCDMCIGDPYDGLSDEDCATIYGCDL